MSDGSVADDAADLSPPEELAIAADLDLLGEVRGWVRNQAAAADFSASDLGDLDLAVTEAVSNVIRHAYGGDAAEQVNIRAGMEGRRFVISIFDTGPPFAGTAAPPDLDNPQEGGYGLHLICAVMDDATWTRLPDGRNQLRLVRERPGLQT